MNHQHITPAAQATWIGSEHPFDLHEAYIDFRRSFELARRPAAAELWITADSRYKLWVNGAFVARGPARCYPLAQSVDRLPVAGLLRPGRNVIAVQVYQPGYSHFAYVHRAAAGLLAWLECDGQPALATDPSWRAWRDRSFAADVPRVSIYGSGAEERDLALEESWWRPEYDDLAWAHARLVAPASGGLWQSLQIRQLALLGERAAPLALLATRRGAYPRALDTDAHMALKAGWESAEPCELHADADGWYGVALEGGQAAYWLFDLGRGYAGQGWAEVVGAAGGEQLVISYADKLRNEMPRGAAVDAEAGKKRPNLGESRASVVERTGVPDVVISDPQTYCRVRLTDRFRLRPGGQQAESFGLRGGRFLLFGLAGPAGARLRLRFGARVSEYPLAVARELRTSDQQLARIVALCENTFRACLADGFVDCTWRESSQWLGDALPQALIMAAMADDSRPLRRAIELAAQGAYPDGVLPGVLPGEAHAYTVVDYNFMWVELLRLYYALTEDVAFVERMCPTLVKLLDRFHQDIGADGLLLSQPGRRLFLDWAPLSRAEPSAVYNLHYLLALKEALALAEAIDLLSGANAHAGEAGSSTHSRALAETQLGELTDHQDTKTPSLQRYSQIAHKSPAVAEIDAATNQAPAWRARADALRGAARAAFLHGGSWHDDRERTTFSQLAAALALLSGAAEANEAPALLQAIAERSLDGRDEPAPGRMVLASPFMHHYIFEALRRGGQNGAVLEIIRRRWGRWAEAGYPTTWENWNVDFPDGSQCHAFSAHPRYHLAEIARERGGL